MCPTPASSGARLRRRRHTPHETGDRDSSGAASLETGEQVPVGVGSFDRADGHGRTRAGGSLPIIGATCAALALADTLGFPAASWGPAAVVVRLVVIVAFWSLGPSSLIVARLRLRRLTRIALVAPLGLAVLIGLSTTCAWLGYWHPTPVTAGAAAVTLAGGWFIRPRAQRASRPRGTLPSRLLRARSRINSSHLVAAGLLAVALASWIFGASRAPNATQSVYGLLASAPGVWLALGLAVGTAATIVALRAGSTALTAACAIGFVLMLRATASIADPAPQPTWSYKHIGVIAAIQAHGHVVAGTDIYMNWPGMFAASGFVSGTSGAAVFDMARWITPFVHVVLALAVAGLTEAMGFDFLAATTAALLAIVLNWVGQDYFSPQAVAVCLAGAVVLTLIQSRTDKACAILAVVLFAATVCTHQLTPFWLLGVAVGLLILRRVPWWVVLAMAALLTAYVGSRLGVVAHYGLFSGFDPVANAAVSAPSVPAPGRDLADYLAKGAAGLMWISTIAVVVARIRRVGWRQSWRRLDVMPAALIAFSAFALLGGQAYGGEAILRVTLYSTIGCSAILGPAVVGLMRRSRLRAVAGTAWVAVLVAVIAEATYSPWWLHFVTTRDVTASRWLAEHAPDANAVAVANDWPGRDFVDYLRYNQSPGPQDLSLTSLLQESVPNRRLPRDAVVPLNLHVVDQAVVGLSGRPTDLVFMPIMQSYDDYYNVYPRGAYTTFLRAVQRSATWSVVFHQGDDWIFRYRGPR